MFDDFTVASTTPDLCEELFDIMRKRYKITAKPAMDTFLSMHFDDLPIESIRFSQPVRINELVQEHRRPSGMYPSVPIDSKFCDKFQIYAPVHSCSHPPVSDWSPITL